LKYPGHIWPRNAIPRSWRRRCGSCSSRLSDLIGPVHDIDDLVASGALRPVQRGIRGSQKTLDGGAGVRIGGDPIDPDSPVIATRSLASPISGNRTTNSSPPNRPTES
jgi:hypothetical protein